MMHGQTKLKYRRYLQNVLQREREFHENRPSDSHTVAKGAKWASVVIFRNWWIIWAKLTEQRIHVSLISDSAVEAILKTAREWKFIRILYAFFWVIPPASEFYMPTFRNTPTVPSS